MRLPLRYFLELKTKATIQIHPISSNSAARSFSFSGHWQMNLSVTWIYLPVFPLLTCVLEALLIHSLPCLSSSSSQSCSSAPKQLQQWLSCHAGLSPRIANVLWGWLLYGSDQQKPQPLSCLGLCSSKRDSSFVFQGAWICTQWWLQNPENFWSL